MKKYKVEVEIELGMSHCGGVWVDGESIVELTDEEVDQLVDLIREHGTSDVDEMELETINPQLYEKLDWASHDAIWLPYQLHWLEEAFYDSECFNSDDLFDKAESEFGFNPDDYDEDKFDCPEAAFRNHLEELVNGMDDEERFKFYTEKLGIEYDPEVDGYYVAIPQEIIDKANATENTNN